MSLLVFAFCLAVHAGNFQLKQVSSDPYLDPGNQHKTEVEPHTFSHGSTIVSAFQVGRNKDGGASNIGWATSHDFGLTWTNGFLPGITAVEKGPLPRVSDPVVSYDAKHGIWMIVSLGVGIRIGDFVIPLGVSVQVSRSFDGEHWAAPVTIHKANPEGENLDKTWIVCDNHPFSPYYGNCYATWDGVSAGLRLVMSASSDGGASWGSPVAPVDNASGFGGQPLIQPNGTIILPYFAAAGEFRSVRSLDGCKSFEASSFISKSFWHEPKMIRAEPLSSAAIDGEGTLYVMWPDCRFETNCASNDLVLSRSADGTSWSDAVRIPTVEGGEHLIAGIASSKRCGLFGPKLAIVFYYFPNANCGEDCDLNIAASYSIDGGESWDKPAVIARHLDWLKIPWARGKMIGDYIGVSYFAGFVHAVIPITNPTELAMYDLSFDL